MEFPYQNVKTVLDLVMVIAELCDYTKSTEFYAVKGVVLTCEWHLSYP